ncbi:MAG: hypothetical protein AB7P76_00380 [Candidatus Melainabacteria bacterium]
MRTQFECDQEIMDIARRIQALSREMSGRSEATVNVSGVKLAKIQDLANLLLPRLEDRLDVVAVALSREELTEAAALPGTIPAA